MLNLDKHEPRLLTKHWKYYLPGGDLYLNVHDVLFRLHLHFLERDSPRIRNLLAPPACPGMEREPRGTDEQSALVIDEKADDFALIVSVIYNPRYTLWSYSATEWTTILRLAHKWRFHEIRQLAIREIDKLSRTEYPIISRIQTFEKYDAEIPRLFPHYLELCTRPESLSEEDAEVLKLKTTVMVFQIRERCRVFNSGAPHQPRYDVAQAKYLLELRFGSRTEELRSQSQSPRASPRVQPPTDEEGEEEESTPSEASVSEASAPRSAAPSRRSFSSWHRQEAPSKRSVGSSSSSAASSRGGGSSSSSSNNSTTTGSDIGTDTEDWDELDKAEVHRHCRPIGWGGASITTAGAGTSTRKSRLPSLKSTLQPTLNLPSLIPIQPHQKYAKPETVRDLKKGKLSGLKTLDEAKKLRNVQKTAAKAS